MFEVLENYPAVLYLCRVIWGVFSGVPKTFENLIQRVLNRPMETDPHQARFFDEMSRPNPVVSHMQNASQQKINGVNQTAGFSMVAKIFPYEVSI